MSGSHAHHHHSEQRPPLRTVLFRIVMALIVVGLLLAYGMEFNVSEGYNTIVTRFGEPIHEYRDTGLHWKAPWPVDRAHEIDTRYRYFNTPFTATFTQDRKNVILLAYVVWKVDNPLLFFQSLGTPEAAEQKLTGMVANAKNFHLGNYELAALVSTDPGQIQTVQIEKAILEDVRPEALDKFGISVEQIGIKRIAFPEENMEAVLSQMRAERKALARELRAKGKKEAEDIRNAGMVKREEILREGREKAGSIIGEADKEAAETYAKAHNLDPDFYKFWRSMEVLKQVLGSQATVILGTDQAPFNELFEPQENRRSSTPGARQPLAAPPTIPASPGAGP